LSKSDQHDPNSAVAEVLSDKGVYRVSHRAFAVIHRSKVECCNITRRHLHDRPGDAHHRVEATTLHLTMSTLRQRMEHIEIGFLSCEREVEADDLEGLVDWLAKDPISILAVAAGDNGRLVETLAVATAAIGCSPVCQDLWCWNSRSFGWECLTHPSYFLLFGTYRSMQWPTSTPTLPDDFELGEDIRSDMILSSRAPAWPRNDPGSTAVPHLGSIKMKNVDWMRWCPQTFQTCLWLGTAIPSKKSQSRQLLSRSKRSGKARGSGKGRGSGK
jgi:hypothetical protein